MLTVDDYGAIRRARRDGMNIREIARTFHHSRTKIRRVLGQPEPIPYTRAKPRTAPVLGPFHPTIDQILAEDEHAPPKQRHTAMQLLRRLRDEHAYPGSYGQSNATSSRTADGTPRDLHPAGLLLRTSPRSRLRTHPCRSPRRAAPGPVDGRRLILLQLPFRPRPSHRAHRGHPGGPGRRLPSAMPHARSGGTTPGPSPR